MIRAKFICPQCKKETVVKFNAGKTPETPECEDCKLEMIRQFGKINLGEITSDEMIHLGQKMLYS